uniref:Hexokinase-3 n=1 Tax=Sphenodon punctatus TaxID=8508 RepID=A0A8D0GNH2_SPHPU
MENVAQPGQKSGSNHVTKLMQKSLQPLNLSQEQLRQVKGRMLEAMERGLSQREEGKATMSMLPTYVRATLDGTERGDFLVLELSQKQVRAVRVQLTGIEQQQVQVQDHAYDIQEKFLKEDGKQLFSFMAKCLAKFLDSHGKTQTDFSLGFSFPFHCHQTGLDHSELISWTKGFQCPGVEGEDVVQLLQQAIDQHCKRYHIRIIAVVNDTVGTMMSCSSGDEPCEIGLVVDAGTNSCYMEEARHVAVLGENEGRMCVNMEWGSFGDDGALDDLLTDYDRCLDQESHNPGKQRFEKLISSLYLGDVVHHILDRLVSQGGLSGGIITALPTRGKVKTCRVLEILHEQEGLAKAKSLLMELGLEGSDLDCFHVQQVCQAVCNRSANLCAAGLAAILTRIRIARELPQLKIAVGIDGEMFRKQAQYSHMLKQKLKFLAPECDITFVQSKDGGGRGVAMVTAAAARLFAQRQQLQSLLNQLHMSTENLCKVQALLRREMELGLAKETNVIASTRMLPSYVRSIPDGSERGDFLALDLGGTNFRVLLVQVHSQEQGGVHIFSEVYSIPPQVAQGTGTQLFDHIVTCIVDFQTKQGMMGQKLPLGFTFSFPCKQTSLDQGILVRWTKGFSASDCVGKDVVQLLREAVKRQQHFDLDVVAIVNDTVGTMMSCGYDDPNCEVGLIVGTGTNACYMEEMQNVGTVEGEEGRMCINMEWGAFGDNGCLEPFMTTFDQTVDKASINPGQQRFEKLISGMYLGEIVRHILLKLAGQGTLFRGQASPALQTKDLFPTKFLSVIESDGLAQRQVRAILEELGLRVSCEDGMMVREVCQVVSHRAAQLCGAAVAAVVEKIRENRALEQLEVTVGVDGTLYKLHPHFSQQVKETVKVLAPCCSVTFLQSEDGSGKGAALIAAVACRAAQQQNA